MSGFVDFARLREQLDMAQVITFLGLQTTTDDGDHHRADCPACNSKNALFSTLSAGKYFYHAEKRGGDAVGLVAHLRHCGQREAGLLLQRELLGNNPRTN